MGMKDLLSQNLPGTPEDTISFIILSMIVYPWREIIIAESI
jgi:hypothetical protein